MPKKKIKISIVICTLNEEQNLPWVLQRIKKTLPEFDKSEIIAVDGHSSDNTVEVAKKFGCRVFFDKKLGKGEALRLGASKARGEIIVFIDADGSHDPKDIKKLLYPIRKQGIDHVSGSRMLGGSDELHKDFGQFVRLVGSAFITLIINYSMKVRLTDCQNGFRAIRRSVFEKLDLKENLTTIEQEMILKTLKKRFKILEIPTHEYERRNGQSHIVIWKYAPRYIYSCFKYLFFS
jgi:dolichol-phosphate mannosyltransferase